MTTHMVAVLDPVLSPEADGSTVIHLPLLAGRYHRHHDTSQHTGGVRVIRERYKEAVTCEHDLADLRLAIPPPNTDAMALPMLDSSDGRYDRSITHKLALLTNCRT